MLAVPVGWGKGLWPGEKAPGWRPPARPQPAASLRHLPALPLPPSALVTHALPRPVFQGPLTPTSWAPNFSPDWIDNWSGLERPEYERKKEEVADAIVARLEKVFPGLKEATILR